MEIQPFTNVAMKGLRLHNSLRCFSRVKNS